MRNVAIAISVLVATISCFPAALSAQKGPMMAVPVGQPGAWFDASSYPPLAVSARREGRTVVRLGIDPTGNIATCEVTLSSGTDILDQATCITAKERGRFNPAIDAEGHSIASSYVLPVRWKLPESKIAAAYNLDIDVPRHQGYKIEQDYSADGKLTTCRVIDATMSKLVTPAALCPDSRIGSQMPLLLRDGKPVAYKTVTTMSADISVVN